MGMVPPRRLPVAAVAICTRPGHNTVRTSGTVAAACLKVGPQRQGAGAAGAAPAELVGITIQMTAEEDTPRAMGYGAMVGG